MAKAKSTRDPRLVIYARVHPATHRLIVKLVEQRGYPHTIASVTAEMIERGLDASTKDFP